MDGVSATGPAGPRLRFLRRRAGMYGEALRRRYTRTRPACTWQMKSIFGLRAMLARLKAHVDLGAIFREEAAVSPNRIA